MNILHRCVPMFVTVCLLLACQPIRQPVAESANLAQAVPVRTSAVELTQASTCEESFTTHALDFSTGTRIREIRTYESNGAGVAVNDLDGDGDLDLVFASVDRESAILWNEGNLTFVTQTLDDLYTRGVAIVDVDGDGALDIVFTHRGLETVSFWRNQGADAGRPTFARESLPGVTAYAYAMAWADLNNDGALDLVVGSYNTDFRQNGIKAPVEDENAGIILYARQGDGFMAQRLAPDAEALSIGLVDLNGDQALDLWVANDFDLQDQVWLRNGVEWEVAKPFANTSHSTMSIEWGDIANNGSLALFTTDMKPFDTSPEIMAAWEPMMKAMMEGAIHVADDPQLMENVLQVRNPDGTWRNEAVVRGVDATGWSWAGKFGDLDNDGYLDLYVVNGMVALNMFGHLPNGELVEENQAFRNTSDGMFAPAPEWKLGATTGGRGMTMADLDNDGDLDIVVNNMRQAAQLFENRLCGGSNLQVDLRWQDGQNTNAIGAQLTLRTSHGVYQRDVRAAGGYLSGDPARVHFGFPADTELLALEIVWPDGASSVVEAPTANGWLTVTR